MQEKVRWTFSSSNARRREAVVGRVRGSGKESPHRLSLPSSASILSIGPSKLSGGTA
jgi:hypothetical protein